MDWKQAIHQQLQEKNRFERDVYAEVVKHCRPSLFTFRCWNPTEDLVDLDNRLSENYSVTLLRCTEQEREILALRQENNDLQKNSARWTDRSMMSRCSSWFYSICSVAGLSVNDKVKSLENDYMKLKDEILTLLRERTEVRFLPPSVSDGWFVILSFLDDQASD